MYGLLWLLLTSGEHFKSTSPLEIYLLGKMVTCPILILPTALPYQGSPAFETDPLLNRSYYFQMYPDTHLRSSEPSLL